MFVGYQQMKKWGINGSTKLAVWFRTKEPGFAVIILQKTIITTSILTQELKD